MKADGRWCSFSNRWFSGSTISFYGVYFGSTPQDASGNWSFRFAKSNNPGGDWHPGDEPNVWCILGDSIFLRHGEGWFFTKETFQLENQTKVCHRLPPRKLPEILFRRDDEHLNIFTGFIDTAVKTAHNRLRFVENQVKKSTENSK